MAEHDNILVTGPYIAYQSVGTQFVGGTHTHNYPAPDTTHSSDHRIVEDIDFEDLSSSVSPESNSGSSSPSPDVKTKPSPVTDNPSPVTDTPSTDLNSILDIPEPNKYTQVRKYIKDRCRFDPEFQRLFDESTRVELCSHLTNLFGWFVDPHHLGVNWNRHH